MLSSTCSETNGAAEEENPCIFQCKQLICDVLVLLANSCLDPYYFIVKILTECCSSHFIIYFPLFFLLLLLPLPSFLSKQPGLPVLSASRFFPSCTFEAPTATGKDGTGWKGRGRSMKVRETILVAEARRRERARFV